MGAKREFEGLTLDEAKERASASLGIPEPDLNYKILETGRRGLFGLGTRNVRIRVMSDIGEAGEPRLPKPPAPADPQRERIALQVEDTVQRMFDLMSLEIKVQGRAADAAVRLQLKGPDRKLLLRKEAELLTAMQFLLNRMARRAWPEAGRIQLTCDGYGRRGDEEVVELAKEVAHQVSRTGLAKHLHPMNPYERRLVHMTVREFEDLTTRSEGDGFLKTIRITRK